MDTKALEKHFKAGNLSTNFTPASPFGPGKILTIPNRLNHSFVSLASTLTTIVVVLFSYLISLQAQEIPSTFSTPEEQYLYFDQNFNVVQRLRTEERRQKNLMSEADKRPVTVNIYEADLKAISSQVYLSQFIEESDAKRILTDDGKLLIPVLESDIQMNLLLRARFGQAKYQTQARKTLSRATYFVEPVGTTGGFFAKFALMLLALMKNLNAKFS